MADIQGLELASAIRVKAIKNLLPIGLFFSIIPCLTSTCTGAAM